MYDDPWSGLDDDTDEHLRGLTEMVATWARATREDVTAYREAAANMSQVDRKMEDGGILEYPEREWERAYGRLWVTGFRLVSSAYQMEKFLKAHRAERNVPHEESKALRTLRNTLEHLDEAKFEWGAARKNPSHKGPRSIDHLPGGRLSLGWSPKYAEEVFGIVSVAKIDERARHLTWFDEDREFAEWEPSDIDFENMRFDYDDGITDGDD